jgi:hypothetical protein
MEPIAFPAVNPDTDIGDSAFGPVFAGFEPAIAGGATGDFEFALADISILILFLLFYDLFCIFALVALESLPTNGASGPNGNVIGILPKKIINRTTPNNNICPPIIKIKSDVEVSITHFSIPTIFV